PALQGVRASGMTLADAPRALQDAVLTTFAGPSQQTELTASDAADFGGAVGISGATAVGGAPYTNSLLGGAHTFTESGGIWSQQAELTPSDPVVVDEFGSFVAVSGSTVVVSAPGNSAAYVFVRSGSVWSQQAELTAYGIGGSVAISGSTVIAGAPY